MRNCNTIGFLGVCEQLKNPDFGPIEFRGIRKRAGLNSFVLTASRWIDATRAIETIVAPPASKWVTLPDLLVQFRGRIGTQTP